MATTQLTEEQGRLSVRSIVLITPVSELDCHIRAVMSVYDPAPSRLGRFEPVAPLAATHGC